MKNRLVVTQAINQVVTVNSGGIPAIMIKSKDGHAEAVMAVNFLRSGCSEVQLILENEHQIKFGTKARMQEFMLKLQLPEEKFWSFEEPENGKNGPKILVFSYHPTMK